MINDHLFYIKALGRVIKQLEAEQKGIGQAIPAALEKLMKMHGSSIHRLLQERDKITK